MLHQRRKHRLRVMDLQRERFCPSSPNQVWPMDFVADRLAVGRRYNSLIIARNPYYGMLGKRISPEIKDALWS